MQFDMPSVMHNDEFLKVHVTLSHVHYIFIICMTILKLYFSVMSLCLSGPMVGK